jgi:hypothetical protein
MCDPQQELFSKLKKDLEAKGFAVYDGFLPPEGTPYPFVYLGDSQQTDDANKSAVFGNVFQTIHVWHNNPRQRGTVSQILLEIKLSCRLIEHTKNFAWDVRDISQQIIPDNTTATPLLHGVLDVEWKFS